MIALDTNVLIDLLVASQPNHAAATRAIKNLNDHLATTSTNLAETLRLLTHPKVFPRPLAIVPAIRLVKAFLESFGVAVLSLEDEWWKSLEQLAAEDLPDLRGNEIFDAQIALCLKHNGVKRIWTHDSDFRKYRFLEIIVGKMEL